MLDKVNPALIEKYKTIEILEKLDVLFDAPDKWHQGSCARDKYGASTAARWKNSYSFCVIGGLARIMDTEVQNIFDSDPANAIAKAAGIASGSGHNIPSWNDHCLTDFSKVKEVVEKAIKNTRAQLS